MQIRLGASWRRRKSHLSAFPRPQTPQSCETKVARQEDKFRNARRMRGSSRVERSYHHTFSFHPFPEIDLRNGRNAVEIRDLSRRFVSCERHPREFHPRVHDRIMARPNDRDEKRYSFVWTLDLWRQLVKLAWLIFKLIPYFVTRFFHYALLALLSILEIRKPNKLIKSCIEVPSIPF